MKVQLGRAIPSQPHKPLGKGYITPINTCGSIAGEGEGIVGNHIGETSGVSSEGHSYGWD